MRLRSRRQSRSPIPVNEARNDEPIQNQSQSNQEAGNQQRSTTQPTQANQANPTANPSTPTLTNQQAFNQVYHDLAQPGSFTRKIAKYLRQNQTHSLHKPRRKKFKRRRIIVYYPYQIIEMDLIDMRNLSGNNRNFKYILLTIDLFSKKIWLRKMKTKSGPETADAIKSVINDMEYPPQTVIFDEGLEFYNKHVDLLFSQYNIHSYSIKTSTKAGAAERGNRTIKSMMWKYFTEFNTKTWIDQLERFQSTYNNTYHRIIKRAPNEVAWADRKKIFKIMYPEIHDRIKCKLQEKDKVRVAIKKSIFEKGYTQNWSKEIYTVTKVFQKLGVCWYRIADQSGKVYPKGKYYYDLNLVARP